jgi:predicted site-specific integrase-resolvase
MKVTKNDTGRSATLSIRQAAWVLGVPTSAIHRWIRVGTLRTLRRRTRLVVLETDIRRLKDGGPS